MTAPAFNKKCVTDMLYIVWKELRKFIERFQPKCEEEEGKLVLIEAREELWHISPELSVLLHLVITYPQKRRIIVTVAILSRTRQALKIWLQCDQWCHCRKFCGTFPPTSINMNFLQGNLFAE